MAGCGRLLRLGRGLSPYVVRHDGQDGAVKRFLVRLSDVQVASHRVPRRPARLPTAARRILEERSVHRSGHLHLRYTGSVRPGGYTSMVPRQLGEGEEDLSRKIALRQYFSSSMLSFTSSRARWAPDFFGAAWKASGYHLLASSFMVETSIDR
jgi:hypothetical protein